MADRAAPPFPPSATPPLVGRERELAALREHLAAALVGHGSLMLIGGEAGVGKTALAEDLLAEASHQGAIVLVGRCYDLSETPPYGPWAEALARAPAGDGLPPSPDFSGAGATSQAALLGQVRDHLAALAARCPVVLLLDDLHWADPASLDLLRTLARGLADMPLLALATYRADEVPGGHPLAALLPLLVREARAARLDLRPLNDDAIAALVAARYALGAADLDRLVGYLARRSEGNALFLGELLRTLEGEGLLLRDEAGWAVGDLAATPVPTLLRQVIAGRIARLDPETQRLLAVAAIIGQEVPLPLWGAVAEVGEAALLDHAERALASGLLVEAPDGARVRFAHALIREALYAETPALRRRALHRRAGEALVAGPHPDPDAVANQFQRAGDPRAVDWLLGAAGRAQRAYARIAAAERVEAALALLEEHGAGPAERGWRCAHLAALLQHAGWRRALVYTERALALADESDDRALAAYMHSAMGLLHLSAGHLRAGLAMLAAAIEAQACLSPGDRERLATRRSEFGNNAPPHVFRGTFAYWLAIAGRYDEGRALAAPLLPMDAIPREMGYAITCCALAMAATNRGRADEGARWFEAARDLAGATGELFLRGHCPLLQVLYLHIPYRADRPGEREQLAAEAAEGYRLAVGTARADLPAGLARLPHLVLAGEWDAAWEVAQAVRASDGLNATNGQAALGPLALARGDTALAWAVVWEVLPAGSATEPGDSVFRTAVTLQRVAAALSLAGEDLPEASAWLTAHDRWLAWSGAVPGRAEGQLGWAAYHRAAGDVGMAR